MAAGVELDASDRQCPTCGAIKRGWAEGGREENELGHKVGTDQAPDHREDRLAAYRKWRRTVKQAGATDFDQVEWRFQEADPYPVALLEMTRVDGCVAVPDSYLQAVLDRITKRDWQGRFAVEGARRLDCRAWIVAFRWNLQEFWVYNLSESKGWWHCDREKYSEWLTRMR